MPVALSAFKNKACILHHFTFLDWSPPHIFLRPITRFLPLKTHFLTTISPFSAMYFMDIKGFIYTISVDIYAFASHLAAFSTAISIILPCV